MWFTNKSHSAINFIKIQWLKKEVEKHFFEVWWEKVEESTFEGKLIKISPSEYEYEGIMRQTIKLLFIDESHEYYQLDIAFNNLSRWLINSLLWFIKKQSKKAKGIILLELSLYINKENYKQMGIKINWERAEWFFSIEEQKNMIETITKKNGTKENDYFEYDEKLKSLIPDIQEYITINDFILEDEKKVIVDEEINIEDIPF